MNDFSSCVELSDVIMRVFARLYVAFLTGSPNAT